MAVLNQSGSASNQCSGCGRGGGPPPPPGAPPPRPVPAPEPARETGQPDDTEADAAYLSAPAVGVFYRAPEPGAEPFVAEGDTVSAGQQVAIVEAMKLMIPVEADQPGRIAKVLKDNGEPVEYGERLFLLDQQPGQPDQEDKP
jgi:acetyl-CoA carboxylase biotin carboxyl carrier protein